MHQRGFCTTEAIKAGRQVPRTTSSRESLDSDWWELVAPAVAGLNLRLTSQRRSSGVHRFSRSLSAPTTDCVRGEVSLLTLTSSADAVATTSAGKLERWGGTAKLRLLLLVLIPIGIVTRGGSCRNQEPTVQGG